MNVVLEALKAAAAARAAGWRVMVSHRSGETEDTFIADLVNHAKTHKNMCSLVCFAGGWSWCWSDQDRRSLSQRTFGQVQPIVAHRRRVGRRRRLRQQCVFGPMKQFFPADGLCSFHWPACAPTLVFGAGSFVHGRAKRGRFGPHLVRRLAVAVAVGRVAWRRRIRLRSCASAGLAHRHRVAQRHVARQVFAIDHLARHQQNKRDRGTDFMVGCLVVDRQTLFLPHNAVVSTIG